MIPIGHYYPLLILYENRHRNSLNTLLGALEHSLPEMLAQVTLYPETQSLLQDLPHYSRCLIVSSMMSIDANDKICFYERVRSLNPRALIAAGGSHLSAGDPIVEERCHWIARGEGEEAFIELVERFQAGEVPKTPQIIIGSPVDLDRYLPFPLQLDIIGPIELMRGCPHGCSFCQTNSLFGSVIRERHPEAVFETVKLMQRHRRSLDLRFVTPNALAYRSTDGISPNPQAVHDFLSGLRIIIGKTGRIFYGSFPSEVRPDSITPDILTVIRTLTNNRRLVIGAQSGSDQSLARLHRGHTRKDILVGVELARQAGFETIVDFIFGLPGETDQDIEHTMETIEQLVRCGAKIHAHGFLPLPGTALAYHAPMPIPLYVKCRLGTLARLGQLFGQWQTQEKLAGQITKPDIRLDTFQPTPKSDKMDPIGHVRFIKHENPKVEN